MNLIMFIGIILGYYFLGAIINGLMHRYDPVWFSNDLMSVFLVVQMWIIVVPLYWFAIFCDRCIYWFEKKEQEDKLWRKNIKKFPEIKVYWAVEEEGMGIYKTNDREGLYFEDRVYVDTCINGDYKSDYFKNTDDAYQWLSEITNDKIKTKKDVEDFNDSISERNPDEFIYVHEYLIIDN